MYKDLGMPSCKGLGVPRGFARAPFLRTEATSVAAFEERMKGSAASLWLDVSREDALLEIDQGSHCWADDDIRFARIHVEMTQRTIATSLKALGQLAAKLQTPSAITNQGSAGNAKFRRRARALIALVSPPCRFSSRVGNEDIIAPARALASAFRKELAGSGYEKQFDIAEADEALLSAITEVECDDADRKTPSYWRKELLKDARTIISSLRGLMGASTTTVRSTGP